MKRKFVSVILTAAVVAGTLSAATVVSADSGIFIPGMMNFVRDWKLYIRK